MFLSKCLLRLHLSWLLCFYEGATVEASSLKSSYIAHIHNWEFVLTGWPEDLFWGKERCFLLHRNICFNLDLTEALKSGMRLAEHVSLFLKDPRHTALEFCGAWSIEW